MDPEKIACGHVVLLLRHSNRTKIRRNYLDARGSSYTSRSYSTEEWSLGRKKKRIIGIAY
jgi:hypothetical protein